MPTEPPQPSNSSTKHDDERRSSTTISLTTTICLLLFALAFFPATFNALLLFPFKLIAYPFRSSSNLLSSPTTVSPAPAYCTPVYPPSISAPAASMSWTQKTLTLPASSRGSYLVTSHVEAQLPEISQYRVGLLHLFMQHTSAALSLNENYDEDVRADMSDALDRIAPEDRKGNLYRHSAEGLDDMPAHIKSALVGASVTVPIRDGRLATGTWQGIWYLEFRASKHSRKVVATIQGEKKS